ncbi:hypothetical protein K432DRAFT_305915, partial [Lepidopterella palustris CBS 459.81]
VSLKAPDSLNPTITTLNPATKLPVLLVLVANEDTPQIIITQSILILEYLEETFPSNSPLLPPPSSLEKRAKARELVNHLIACDIQSPTNQRIAQRMKTMRGERDDALHFVMITMQK